LLTTTLYSNKRLGSDTAKFNQTPDFESGRWHGARRK
jgi:hypothetical protein